MQIIILILAAAGILTVVLATLRRKHEDHDKPLNVHEHHPISQIKSLLFLDIPTEYIVGLYFIAIFLLYVVFFIFGISVAGLSLAALYLSGIVFLLQAYNCIMVANTERRYSIWVIISLFLSAGIFYAALENIDRALVPLLENAFEYSLTVHILGVVLGLGGALCIDLMIFHFLKNFKITRRESVIMHMLSQMIIFGLILLMVSGLALFASASADYLASSKFLMKMVTVVFVLVNGIVLNLYVVPKMEKISLQEKDQGRHEMLTRVAFIVGAVSVISWFSAYFLAMLDILNVFSLGTLLIVYAILLSLAVGGSLFTKKYYEAKAIDEGK